jgi:RNA polymerase sigma factor (sigma-70 family)
MSTHSIRHLKTVAIAERCAEETARFYQRKSSSDLFCYELFRRAILKRESAAWEALVKQYRPQIRRWIRRAGSPDEDSLEDLTQDAILRFWRAYNSDQFAQAGSLSEILRYWQDCARSALLDWSRRERHKVLLFDSHENLPHFLSAGDRPEVHMALREARLKLWELVRHHCKDEVDMLLAQRVFVEGCKPRQVHSECPQWFVRRTDLYQRLRNLKDRLRRDPLVQKLLRDCLS